ncbi:MAG TPA: zinc ribbon domain-containing protein [Gemmataceae bacterium]|nr:zinc ribbon domain-containing protein [Gemmataceae bacterium]
MRSVTCHGCGKQLVIPDGFARRKMQCPDCGVYCDVDLPGKKGLPAASKPVKQAPRQSAVDDEALFADAFRQPEPARAAPRPPVKPRAAKDPLPPASPVPSPKPPAAPEAEDPDDGSAYKVSGPDLIRCEECRKQLPVGTKRCPHCGYNFETGERPVKVYSEVYRVWEAGMPFTKRRLLFIACQILVLPMAVLGAVTTDHWAAFLTPWFFFTLLLAFLLGTFDRLELTRDKRGKVRLTKTWRVFFVSRPTQVIRIWDYEGVATGPADRSCLDWVICFLLLPAGIVPAVIFWYLVLFHENFHVSLTQHHGFPEMILYHGSNQDRVREIAETLHEVAEVPYSG